ncbi:MAG: terminase small subunit [Candidatus Hodarchaeales archaeon]
MKYSSVKVIKPLIENYFASRPDNELTITGLALALDTSRETLMNYESKDEFFDTIKRAKDRIQESYERSMRKRGNAGDIFALKNFGWKDKVESEVKITGDVRLTDLFKANREEDEE